MAPFKLEAIARRHQPASLPRTVRRPVRLIAPLPPEDARAGQLFRGLLYGVPIGLAMWLFLALLLWRLT